MAITFTNDSATIGTGEYSLPADTTSGAPTSQTSDGKYQFYIDLANMASGDQYQIRLYEKCDSAGTQRLVEEWIRTNAQARPMFVFPPDGAMVLGEGWDVTVKKLTGTDRSIAWSIRNSVDTGVADIQSRLPAALTAGGNIKADVFGFLGTVLTETSGQIAAAFRQFFNIASPTSTANLITAVTTTANLTNDSTGITTLLARLTSVRAGYLDNLNIGGSVASSSEATAIQNNTRCVRVVPDVIERPDSGTITYRIELLLYDEVGNMEAPDSAPTIALVNQSGTDLSSRLDSATMTLVSAGRYRAIYTASSGDTLEQLVWAFSVVEGSTTRIYGNTSLIVDTTAADFTSSDRITLGNIYAAIDTEVPAIKAKTDQLTFTNALKLDASILAVADFAAAVANKIADHIKRRSQANTEGSADGDTLGLGSIYGLIQMAQEANTTDNADKLTVYKTDGVTELAQKDITTDAGAEAITGIE